MADSPLVPLPEPSVERRWPTGRWPTASVVEAGVEAGVDVEEFIRLVDELMDGDHPVMGRTFAFGLVADGALVAERYGRRPVTDVRAMSTDPPTEPVTPATPLLSWSMAKSLTAMAVGIAVGDGILDPNDPVDDPRWREPGDRRAEITWWDLLTMRPGLAWTEEYYDLDGDDLPDVVAMLFGDEAADMAGFAASKPLTDPPGSDAAYRYSSGTTNILAANLARVLDLDAAGMEAFLRERILDPIGIVDAELRFDGAGTFIGSSYAFLTLGDWCRFGLFALRDGVWAGRRLLPAGWIDEGRRPRSADTDDKFHGAHWWTWERTDGAFGAHGFEGQRVLCVPGRDLVIVRLGRTGSDGAGPLTEHLFRIAETFPLR